MNNITTGTVGVLAGVAILCLFYDKSRCLFPNIKNLCSWSMMGTGVFTYLYGAQRLVQE